MLFWAPNTVQVYIKSGLDWILLWTWKLVFLFVDELNLSYTAFQFVGNENLASEESSLNLVCSVSITIFPWIISQWKQIFKVYVCMEDDPDSSCTRKCQTQNWHEVHNDLNELQWNHLPKSPVKQFRIFYFLNCMI